MPDFLCVLVHEFRFVGRLENDLENVSSAEAVSLNSRS
jgi:hypothetical protein